MYGRSGRCATYSGPDKLAYIRLPARAVSGISTLCGDVAEWLKAAVC